MLSYELCTKLKEAGFPQEVRQYEVGTQFYFTAPEETKIVVFFKEWINIGFHDLFFKVPTLSELIEACGRESRNYPWGEDAGKFDFCLQYYADEWTAGYKDPSYHESWDVLMNGATPEEAVANLWLSLHQGNTII